MSLVTGDLIERAQLISHPYGFIEQVSPAQLLSFLSSLDLEIAREVNQVMPSLLSTQASNITISASTNAAGYSLEPALGYTQFVLKDFDTGKESEVHVVMEADWIHPSRQPSAMVVPDSGDNFLLLPSDSLGEGWDDPVAKPRSCFKTGDTLKYRYIPLVPRLTTLTDELVSPDFTSNYIVQSMVTLLLQLGEAPVASIETSLTRERAYGQGWRMQLYKHARIHTPNHDFDSGLDSYVVNNVITR